MGKGRGGREYTASGISSATIVQMSDSEGNNANKKIDARPWSFGALTTIENNGGSITTKLKGTNNNDTSDSNGEDLITNSNTGNDQADGRARFQGYDYVFVETSSLSSSPNLSNIFLVLVP